MSQVKSNLLASGIKKTIPGFGTAIFFSLFINVLAFVGPLYMLQVYDRVITSRNETTLVVLTLIAAFLLLVYAMLERIRSAVLVRVGVLFDEATRAELFERVLRGTVKQPGAGHFQALRDLDSIREFLTGAGLIAFCDVPWIPIFIAGAFLLHPWFGYLGIVAAILIFAITVLNEILTRTQLKSANKSAAIANNQAVATFRNAEVLHAMGMWRPLRDRWLGQQQNVMFLQAVASDRAGFLVAFAKFLRVFMQVATLGIGGYLVIQQECTPGSMVAASIIIGRALAPVEMAVSQWKAFLAARSAYDRINQLLTAVPEEAERMRLPAPKGQMTLENVFVTPPGAQRPSIRGVNVRIEAGSAVGVVGPSAAGKSTLARALVGVWPAAVGHIRIDGADLSHWNSEELGQHIGYLPQDVELFAGTVAENIARFSVADEAEVIRAAELAGVHAMIQSLPGGYNTQIGEAGHALSGGQRQRIGLARALFGLPSLVVLDEPNASLDSDGEQALLNAVQHLKALKRTVILITHKTSTLQVMDKILVLNQGEVQAFGDRDEIFQKLMAPRVARAPMAANQ
ncbi:MAG TPA: type I secretion system permease/ATPase [Xanthobacteraceae bacterium]|nr:type I secretion system permease/ATPase [Xanthobacteraceae bacterium]